MPNATKGFNKFAPDFIYRYKKVQALTYPQLLDAALLLTHRAQAQGRPLENAPPKDVT